MSENDIAISVSNVSKSFKLPHESQNSLKGKLINFNKRGYEVQEALKDISFEVKKGEFFGIVGRNGSGKSTLLKILAGIYAPNSGNVTVNGKLTPFIELGVGFNHELSGRDNVFLNGALLGFSRGEMDEMYDDIVNFAELERFMDQKLKNYSSGMQVRLAFSIAIRAQSDILVLDEVLAVGDEAFQQKCIDIFESYKKNGQTVILVTHDMAMVKKFCTRAMLISNGNIASIGDPDKISVDYTTLNNQKLADDIGDSNRSLNNAKTKLNLISDPRCIYGDTVRLDIDWSKLLNDVKNIGVAVYKNTGEYIYGVNTINDKIDIGKHKKISYSAKMSIGEGTYHFKVGLFGDTDKDIIEFIHEGPEFMIYHKKPALWEGMIKLDHEWEKE